MMECEITSPHIESYNYLADYGVRLAARDVPVIKLRLPNGDAAEFWYTSARLGFPSLNSTMEFDAESRLYPAECRQRAITYRAPLKVDISISLNGHNLESISCIAGEIPVMLRSNRCSLDGLSTEELIRHGEELNEPGGYFIANGSEKVVRLLVANKRNFPVALKRASLREKGKLYSEYAIQIRSVRENHTVSLIYLHYMENSNIIVSLQWRGERFYLPIVYILKCLVNMNDSKIYESFTSLRPDDIFWASCVKTMLSCAQNEGIITQSQAISAIGSRFRVAFGNYIAPWEKDEQATRFFLHHCLLVHLSRNEDKFYFLAFSSQKLVSLVRGEIMPESLDNPQFQEADISGTIMLMQVRKQLENFLLFGRKRLDGVSKKKPDTFVFTTNEMKKALGLRNDRSSYINRPLEYFLATGSVNPTSHLGLMQETGFSVMADRINYIRFVSHFRAIHRGAFFTQMRTTDVRKLRPEAWGFVCPVHTPDGAPCGLLNHLTASTRAVTHYDADPNKLAISLFSLGVIPHSMADLLPAEPRYPVLVDGNFIGSIPYQKAAAAERHLRAIKLDPQDERVPFTAEIILIRRSTDPDNIQTQFPGLYIFTSPGRLIRPVKNLLHDRTEFIGLFEQVYLHIVIDPEDAEPGFTIHQELHPSALFSFAGNLIPFPDHNQSPRNVYQCQMAKQTMGVPVHAWRYRADHKMYLLQFPQSPLVKPEAYDMYSIDDYPLGANACVAVISYTGYDMEDAMVINRASYQRGFGHGTVIKVERINLVETSKYGKKTEVVFMADPDTRPQSIDTDGLPIEGRLYQEDDPYYCTFNFATGSYNYYKFRSSEPAYCSIVRIVAGTDEKTKNHALIQWRIQRNPIIGDKFASRHGQKGINSFLWPPESLPFSESGMVPDIIFNPHGFPSRMTIGMMIESMAGK